jgi:methyltransferase
VVLTVPTSVSWYLALVAAVGVGRLYEMRLSRRHQRALAAQGTARAAEPGFGLMVALHGGVLAGCALEVLVLRRPFTPAVAGPALAAFALANALRWWVIATLGPHWNVQVVGSLNLGVITGGPYRWVRHPNYVAVFVELVALPLIHGAWLTALLGGALHVVVLRRRLALEEGVLMADPDYRRQMAGKPRFVPRLGRASAGAASWPTS